MLLVLVFLLKGKRPRIEWNVAADASSEAESPADNELRPIDSNLINFSSLSSLFRDDWEETVLRCV